ncbi:APC family permease [Streptomyces sp. NPDC014802]|uniref:APC family permease n=1 Tax=Streptomyces sp. NPDC014802 TaxID=3364917 RepID=UPI0036FABB5B
MTHTPADTPDGAAAPPAPAPAAASPGARDDGGSPAALARVLGPVGAVLLTLSCITPASSLFILVPELFAGQGTGAPLTIAVGIVISVAVGACYAELGTLTPSSGGEYAMVDALLGRFLGWVTFAMTIAMLVVIPPVIALGTADYLADLVRVDPQVAGCAVMLVAIATAVLDVKSNALVTGAFLVLEVVAAAVVAVLGFAHAQRSPSVLVHPEVSQATAGAPAFTAGLLVSGLAAAMFVVNGFGTASYLAEEIHRPRRNVARAVFWSLFVGAAVIVVPAVAAVLGTGSTEALSTATFSDLVRGWAGDTTATVIDLCVALAILNAVLVMVLQNARVVYASGRDRAWPAPVNRALTRLHPRFGSPWVATLAISLPGAALACFADLSTLYEATGAILAVVYVLLALAALAARRAPLRGRPAWRMPLWPLAPVVVLASVGYVLYQQAGRDLAITGGVIAAAALYHVLYLRRHPHDRWQVAAPEADD